MDGDLIQVDGNKLARFLSHYRKIISPMQKARRKLINYEKEIKYLQEKVSSLKGEPYKDLEREKKDLERQVGDFRRITGRLEGEVEALRASNDVYQTTNETLREDIKDMREKNAIAEQTIRGQQVTIASFKEDLVGIFESLSALGDMYLIVGKDGNIIYQSHESKTLLGVSIENDPLKSYFSTHKNGRQTVRIAGTNVSGEVLPTQRKEYPYIVSFEKAKWYHRAQKPQENQNPSS